MDPWECLDDDVLNYIAQHLTVRDILNATLVSPAWNESIGKSSSFVKKIWLKFYEPIDDVQALMKSDRKYQNFKLQRELRETLVPVFNKFQWKRAMLRDEKLPKMPVLQLLAATVEELDIWNFGIVSAANDVTPIDFLMLKKLEFDLALPDTLQLFLGQNPRLHEVDFHAESMYFLEYISPKIRIHEFLKKNPQIRKLHCGSSINDIFEMDISRNVNLNLQSFTFGMNFEDEEKENFVKFFVKQTNLEQLHAKSIRDWTMFSHLYNNASNCRFIEIGCVFMTEGEVTESLIVNPKVVSFKIHAPYDAEYFEPGMTILLRAMPNLRILSMPAINKEYLLIIVTHLMSLRVLRFKSMKGNIFDYYNELKVSGLEINRNIKLQNVTQTTFARKEDERYLTG